MDWHFVLKIKKMAKKRKINFPSRSRSKPLQSKISTFQKNREQKKGNRFSRIQEGRDRRTERQLAKRNQRKDTLLDVIDAREDIVLEKAELRAERGLARTEALRDFGTSEGVQAGLSYLGMGAGQKLAGNQLEMAEMPSKETKDFDMNNIEQPKDNKSIMMIVVAAIIALFIFRKKS